MIPISSAAPRPAAVPGAQTAERLKEARALPASPSSSGALRPVRDEYVPEERQEASFGRYWMGKDENGSPKVYFDDPEAAKDGPAPAAEEADGEKPSGAPKQAAPAGRNRKEERCTGNTDAVDREIKKLKEKRERLEKQLASETDETKRKELERKLSQVESELRQKDNDSYRRQHTTFTES